MNFYYEIPDIINHNLQYSLFFSKSAKEVKVCLVFVCFIFSSDRNLTLNKLERNLTRDVIIMNSKYYESQFTKQPLLIGISKRGKKSVWLLVFYFFSSNGNLNLN